MVNYEDMHRFITLLFDQGYFKHQRFGQAFCNHFNVIDSKVFYETSRKKVMNIIYKTYITVCDKTGDEMRH